jgi:hypothetical protein
MRKDAVGIFWDDTPPPKPPPKEKPKRHPPARTWEADDYLPGLHEALSFPVAQFNNEDLFMAYLKQEVLAFDIECYVNFFQIAFKSATSGKVIDFCMCPGFALDTDRIWWIVQNFTIVGFNSHNYDMIMLALALAGKDCATLKEASNAIIMGKERPQDILRRNKVKHIRDHVDHIDLIEVAPLAGSLKIYAGRLHAPRMQDLPFAHYKSLSGPQMAIVRWYCINDLTSTLFLYNALAEQLKLRVTLSRENGIDLRSKSDAQIAEAVISEHIERLNGTRPRQPDIPIGTVYRYQVPSFLRYATPTMQWVLERVRNAMFIVGMDGRVGMPGELDELVIPIADAKYRMGIGGLHSSETTVSHLASDDWDLCEIDVESYYPRIILNQKLYPQHLGPNFLRVYEEIVNRRLQAKHTGDKVTSDSLKITINGSFGKLGSKYSVLYAPDLLIQVTVTGQLCLLMLIERLEMAGITVVSANTDGIAIKCHASRRHLMRGIVTQWEQDTDFKTEETPYRAIYCRDVNNYIAVKRDGTTKQKGVFANPWATEKSKDERLKKNPTSQICMDAVTALLVKGTPIERTIRECIDVTKFVNVRNVKGGAVKNGEYLGKAIRWYYATGEDGEIIYASNGNKVPRSDGARPIMDLPSSVPADIDFAVYEAHTVRILQEIAYLDECKAM